jgi:hypothetical protein
VSRLVTPVDHRGIDDLALTGSTGLYHCARDPEGEVERAAAIVADEIQRWNGRAAHRPDHVERAGQRDVIDVVAGGLRQWPFLTPPSGAAIDQRRPPRQALCRTDAEALHHARPEALDHHVRLRRKREKTYPSQGVLEIDRDRPLVASTKVEAGTERAIEIGWAEPIHAQHVGAHVAEQHPAEGDRSHRGDLDDFQTVEWPHGALTMQIAGRMNAIAVGREHHVPSRAYGGSRTS